MTGVVLLGLILFGGLALGAFAELWAEHCDARRHQSRVLVDQVATVVERNLYG